MSSTASEPRRLTFTVVCGSSAVVTTTRPLGSRIWRETLPGVSNTCIATVRSPGLVPDLPGVGAADPSPADLARLADAVAGVEKRDVVEGKRSDEHVSPFGPGLSP